MRILLSFNYLCMQIVIAIYMHVYIALFTALYNYTADIYVELLIRTSLEPVHACMCNYICKII